MSRNLLSRLPSFGTLTKADDAHPVCVDDTINGEAVIRRRAAENVILEAAAPRRAAQRKSLEQLLAEKQGERRSQQRLLPLPSKLAIQKVSVKPAQARAPSELPNRNGPLAPPTGSAVSPPQLSSPPTALRKRDRVGLAESESESSPAPTLPLAPPAAVSLPPSTGSAMRPVQGHGSTTVANAAGRGGPVQRSMAASGRYWRVQRRASDGRQLRLTDLSPRSSGSASAPR